MKVTQAAIESIVARWRRRLGLDKRWTININLHGAEDWPAGHDDDVAFVDVAPGYFAADIYVHGPAAAADGDPLEHIILHELVHVVLWPMWVVVRDSLGKSFLDAANDMNEAATEQMTRALLNKAPKS